MNDLVTKLLERLKAEIMECARYPEIPQAVRDVRVLSEMVEVLQDAALETQKADCFLAGRSLTKSNLARLAALNSPVSKALARIEELAKGLE